uniref:Protein stum homolog n=1 Tax=Rhabditophanes sp. KR3021 TaxID=114890 RepID=A0AC35U6D4_9BILA
MHFNEDFHSHAEQTSFINEKRLTMPVSAKHGKLRRAIPCMTMPNAVFCACCNFVIPGLGTFLASFAVLSGCNYESEQPVLWAFLTNLLTAFLQLLTTPILFFGWFWSMLWGVIFVQLSRKWWISNIHDRDSVIDYCPCSRC